MPALRSLVWLLAALAAAAPQARLAPGNHRVTLHHDGRARRYLVHVPPAAASGRALPVLLSFHGAGGSPAGHQRFTQTDSLADRKGFLVVYPEGTDSGGLLVWNAGTCCGPRVAGQVDDVGFALAVVDDLARRVTVDPHRLYATGISNGGMMAHRLAAEASTRVAAIAPVAGGLVYPRLAPGRPVPVLHIHSLDDPIALYRGGLRGRLAGVERMNPNIDRMMARWAAADGCTGGPDVATERRDARGHTARLLSWSGCAGGSAVRLWQLTGAGHVWPGQQLSRGLRLLGTPTTVIDANEEIWKFVSRFRR
ncbi:MAG TPA: PHB depolymerase family esterase [Thermoanaerobaculia bacterium]|nr:PHB depolymerase family esterase [Thermoanaerobaculia bacterium]